MNVTAMSCSAVGMGPIYYQWENHNSLNNSWIGPSQRAVNITSPDVSLMLLEKKMKVFIAVLLATNDVW